MRNFGFRLTLALLLVLAVASIAGLAVKAQNNNEEESSVFRARLTGFGEVPPILNEGEARFEGVLSDDETSMAWTLEWSGLSGPAGMAHIHFGPPQNNGGVMVFFCGGGGRPACPDDPTTHGGSLSGTWTSTDIVGPAAQDVTAGNFEGFVSILRHRLGYANIHTALHTSGEIRGQVHIRRHHEREHEE